jgi:SPP1 gp7 family putative phage head morphogenesis protein
MPKPRTLPAVRPSLGLEAEYRRKLVCLLDEMSASIEFWLKAAYRRHPPVMAQDQPAVELRRAIRRMARRWMRRWNEAAWELGWFFATRAQDRADGLLQRILKRNGVTVEFRMTLAARDILNATVGAQVGLIKSIPQQYLQQVEQSVMRSVQEGRDLHTLSKELREHYGVSRRRAAFIAQHQNNMATASMTRARQTEIGIKRAVWLHSHAGIRPRPSHLRNHGKEYDVAKGWYDPDEKKRIWPGTLPNCRCTAKSVVPGFS